MCTSITLQWSRGEYAHSYARRRPDIALQRFRVAPPAWFQALQTPDCSDATAFAAFMACNSPVYSDGGISAGLGASGGGASGAG